MSDAALITALKDLAMQCARAGRKDEAVILATLYAAVETHTVSRIADVINIYIEACEQWLNKAEKYREN